MIHELIPYVFLFVNLACGIAIVIRFRGSPGAVLGGIAFGVFIATNITSRVLDALGIQWWQQYNLWFTFANLAAGGCLLAAIITGRTYGRPQLAAGETMGQAAAYMRTAGEPISIPKVLFSFNGRISRSEYWLKGYLILLPFGILTNILAYGVDSDAARALGFLIGLISLWPGLAILIKRWHDRDRSAWWLLTLLIPLLNFVPMVWIFIEVWFLKGTDGANRFGADPLQRADQG